jgi:hypothetical protein
MNALRGLTRLTLPEFKLLARAWLLLARTRLALWLLPWHRLRARPDGRPNAAVASPFSIERLAWAVRAAGRLIPRSTCLTQALALSRLLRSEGHACTVRIGVSKEDGRFAAHAWVECDGVPLLSSAASLRRYSRFLTWPPAQPDVFQ